MARMESRNVVSARGRTSMRLEPEMWDAAHEICLREAITLAELVQMAETDMRGERDRTSAVRRFLLRYFQAAATEAGHVVAGHGVINQTTDPGD